MMKRKKEWAVAGFALGLGLILPLGGELASQVGVGVADACPPGMEEGSIGISGLDCVGECSLTITRGGSERTWFFSTEPMILGVEEGGPSDGILQAGDFLVAIDGVLITSREGGRAYANLQSGERARVRYRRDGRVREATIEVGSRCREARAAPSVGRRVPLPPLPDEPTPTRGSVVAPRVRVTTDRRVVGVSVDTVAVSSVGRRATTGILAGASPTGRLGIGFQCSDCGTRTDEETGENVWFFSGPLEVTAVHAGGAADKAGIQRGDLIKAINGHDLSTDEGGLALTRVEPGVSVRLTVVKRNGSEVEVSLVPEDALTVGLVTDREPREPLEPRRARDVTARAVPSPRRVDAAPPVPTAVPDRVDVPEPTPVLQPPEGLPLRYSGTVNGVVVEVWGEPVTVSEARGARTLYINAEGLWIRITVPGRDTLPRGEPDRLPVSIRR